MEEIKKEHGGKRAGCGRKPKNRNHKITIRVTDEVAAIIRVQKNYNDFIESLVLGKREEDSKQDSQ